MKPQKCKNCKEPIPKGKECYVKAKKVCEKCYYKLKSPSRRNRGGNTLVNYYKRWSIL